ncbi:TAR DNA-binding protein 43-like isoform X2 [Ctenocephalides felis]|uniref:TAR DNA-binding protein 43-like isoform X2 n=1 Tax=Ctenocephalides felis TaxID=7515 RepID=UPI000E6E37EA|nr:TAR DNA-binding protein 43-like isoform X2 [Ctenocephalides felis]
MLLKQVEIEDFRRMAYVQIAEDETSEPVELPLEEDGTLLLSTLTGQYPGASGLKFHNPCSKAMRGLRLADGRLHPPTQSGWPDEVFFCVFPKENKRKSDDTLESSTAKTKRVESKTRTTDLVVLGIPWKVTEDELRKHFENFGEVLMVHVKKDKAGQSKGFGFVRMGSYGAQVKVLSQRHMIDGRWCDVRIPGPKEGTGRLLPSKVFVGRCTEEMTAEDIRDYFSQFGEVVDVYIPKPFRAFSFVTFLDPEVAQSLCGEDHILNGVSVHVSTAAPKSELNKMQNNKNNNGQMNQNGRPNDGNYTGNGIGQPINVLNSNDSYQGRGNMDMPNLQTLGLNSQGQNTNGQNLANMGLAALNALPMNPALVAAALNQVGWGGLLGNLQQQLPPGNSGNNQGFSPGPINNYGSPGPNNQQQPGQNGPTNNYLNWMPQHPNGSQQTF